ncbi:5'-3' exonuclease [Pseudogracilibacillus auburnensis]|nr:5'-3' exonuclease [Pseudogracilibacillus auburnensis]
MKDDVTLTNRILLVDGMALLFRGYYATAYSGNFMKNDHGIATNGVHQFLRYFLDAIKQFDPTHVFCCWDMGSQTFRSELYDSYKANRGEPPEELIPQFTLVKEVVDTFNIPNIGLVNYEADDIIGSIANQYCKEHEIIIQTGDYDLLQLVRENVDVAIMKKGIGNYDLFQQANFYDKKGLQPHQIIEFKGFTGDSADNYPGIKGIGEKTATKLLQTYETFAAVLEAIDELPPGVRKKIQENMDMFYLSKQLAEIKCDIPIDCVLDEAKIEFDIDSIDTNIKELGVRIRSIGEFM